MSSFVDSFVRFGWATSLWGANLLSDLVAGPPQSAVQAQDRSFTYPGSSGSLDVSTFVVLGDGLPAGMADFALTAERQRRSFPALLARQMGTGFAQRFIEPPGIGNAPGFPRLRVRGPGAMQATILEHLPESANDLCDFALPGLRMADVLSGRPRAPLIQRDDATQTSINLMLGLPDLGAGADGPLPTALERVVGRRPTTVMIALGFDEVLEAATAQDPARLPPPESMAADYERIVDAVIQTGARIIAINVPDPVSTAYFSSLPEAATLLRASDGLLETVYELEADARIALPGLVEIGNQLLRGSVSRLSSRAILHERTARTISAWVADLNRRIDLITRSAGGCVFDLAAWLECFKQRAITIGSRRLTAGYLGGFYSLNGYYPGATGHALIANALLDFFNAAFDASFPTVDVGAVLTVDPTAMGQIGRGRLWTTSDVQQRPDRSVIVDEASDGPSDNAPVDAIGRDDWDEPAQRPLTLPPGLVQTLPLCKQTSYFGEAIRAVDCSNERDRTYGTCPDLLFNGLVLTDSHLTGRIQIRFTPPDQNVTHFQLTLPEGLAGDDSTLIAPCLFEFPFIGNRLMDYPGVVSSGDLDLATGEVTNLSCSFGIATSGLAGLASVNPNFPRQAITFPGQYGSAFARFDPRPDGLLDFAFFGTTFLPLGGALGEHAVRLPLPFAGPSLDFASIPARGTVMHPHVCLNTRDIAVDASRRPDVPENTVREFTFFSHNSSFGDHFLLNVPDLGGDATGRSHLLGRAEVQFGVRSGNSVPVVVTVLGPGGLLKGLEPSPISQAFPGRLSIGPLGCDEFLRFPLRSYFLEGVSLVDDPFDISVGAVDLRSGRLLADLLHRGFLEQDLFLALLRIEPRTPKSSFYFRGPARFERTGAGTVMRFKGHTIIPYPQGFRFPQPDLVSAFTAGPGSLLDPFLWLHAFDTSQDGGSLAGGESNVLASNGDRFSYAFAFDSAGQSHFEYTNLTQGGSFRLHSLTWIDFARSSGSGAFDAVSFSGFGIWTKNGVDAAQQASVHISTNEHRRYIGILIDGGAVSNVNTKPANLDDVIP